MSDVILQDGGHQNLWRYKTRVAWPAWLDVKLKKKRKLIIDFYRYCLTLMPMLSFILPTIIPVYFWGESWIISWHVATMLRHTYALNCIFLINSAAHMWGWRPYDR